MTKPEQPEHPESNASADELRALSAFIDDESTDAERAETAARIARDPASAATVAAYRAQDNALRALFAATTDQEPQVVVVRPRRRYLMAASWLAVGIACGFLMHMLLPVIDRDRPAPTFAQRADIAYAVYAPEQRHAVEVAASQEDHLVTWLSKRLNRTLTIPSLHEYGFELVGGRLLPGEDGPAAQFMYQNASGERLTLYMTSSTGKRREEYAIRMLRDGARRTFYWTTEQAGYALSGQIGEAKLRAITFDTCAALGGDPKKWQ
ncbi:transmembrane transcriptional regulator (anti-sigma factor) [Caballeronia sordidicola]|uniref:Transmembrane transcriptional regulator (Anti-sigma factor) n=1 Tax=Caballeronia sordidicola TaxID=196367 RepID=A0A158I2X8_CABSO|nr:anti-sigma factor [Caballeronia sordidicola]SAL50693.1 transmembrane transcriptional regulator (anti-sigma factor) [Caballeronia sordidicola]